MQVARTTACHLPSRLPLACCHHLAASSKQRKFQRKSPALLPVKASFPQLNRFLCHATNSSNSSNGNGRSSSVGSSSKISWLHSAQTTVAKEELSEPILSGLDAVIMLAGGLKEDGGMPEWGCRRLDACKDLQSLQAGPCPILLLGGGTPHKPPILTPSRYVVHEATACAQYLLERGVPATTLLKEVSSYDTVGNAYFSLVIHAVPAGWRRLGVVTSDFHMPRTRALFEDMYGLAGQELFGGSDRFQLSFVAVSDEGVFEPQVLQARRDKEAQALATWRRDFEGLRGEGLRGLHCWLHQTHQCYAVPRQHEFAKRTIKDDRLLSSY